MAEKLVEALDKYAQRHSISRSEAIRLAVVKLLGKKYEKYVQVVSCE